MSRIIISALIVAFFSAGCSSGGGGGSQNGPDLSITADSDSYTFDSWSTKEVAITAANNGTEDAVGATVSMTIDSTTGPAITVTDEIGAPIPAFDSEEITIPMETLTPGTYTLTLALHVDGDIDTSNDAASFTITVRQRPDLALIVSDVFPSDPVSGETLFITYSVSNAATPGSSSSDLTTLRVYQSFDDGSTTLLDSFQLHRLSPGETSTFIYSDTIPAEGSYTFWAVVDEDALLDEESEVNNSQTTVVSASPAASG
ncbi:MAG: CARDB domain-containing protein [Planctomycetota bacterium]